MKVQRLFQCNQLPNKYKTNKHRLVQVIRKRKRSKTNLPVNRWANFPAHLLKKWHNFGISNKTPSNLTVNVPVQRWRQLNVANKKEKHAQKDGQ